MKKTIILFCLAASVSLARAQEMRFKLRFMPNKIYQSDLHLVTSSTMDVSADSAILNVLRSKGMKMPMLLTGDTQIISTIKTGDFKEGNYFPLTVSYEKVNIKKTVNGTASPDSPNELEGSTVFARYTAAGSIQVDTMFSKNMTEALKSSLRASITTMVNSTNFPERGIKPGDTFTQNVPLKLPIPGVDMTFIIKVVYKLDSVQGNVANFDIDEDMLMNANTQSHNVDVVLNGSGTGKGKMTYNIKESYADNLNTELKMTYTMKMGNKLTFNGSATVSTKHVTTIADIK